MTTLEHVEKVNLLGVDIFKVTLPVAAEMVLTEATLLRSSIVVTPNVDHFVNLNKSPEFRKAYDQSSMFFADGAPVVWLSHLLPGASLPERVTGADLFPLLCEEGGHRNLSIAVIGTTDAIVEQAKVRLARECPGLRFVGHYSPPMGFEKNEDEIEKIVALCNEWKANLVVLSLGAPKQELLAVRIQSRIECGVLLCFGASVDFYAGAVQRAPHVVRKIGMEWFWRLVSEPRRMWRRYLVNDPVFIVMAARQLFQDWSAHFGQSGNLTRETAMSKKDLVKKCLPWIDMLAAPAVLALSFFFKLLRTVGLHRLPLSSRALRFVGVFPVRNHYYEPQFVFEGDTARFSRERSLPGLDWRKEQQAAFLDDLSCAGELTDLPREAKGPGEYFLSNGNFEAGDAEFLYQFIRHTKPARIIEIGSGFSTLMAAKAVRKNKEEDLARTCEHICIEPFEMPWLEQQGVKVMRQMVEHVGIDLFRTLESGDLLFIDSSHMIRPEGDVLFEFLELLPQLKPGVYVHVHDIFSPRNYPKSWLVDEVRFWNEQYLLEAFLSGNREWEIVAGLNFLQHNYPEKMQKVCPYLTPSCEPGSFYMRKVA